MISVALSLVALSLAFPSAAACESEGNAVNLLRKVSSRYAHASSYHIEAVQQRSTHNALERRWQKEFLTIFIGPHGKYRYEGLSGHGSAVLVSDGLTTWDYHIDEKLYTQRTSVSSDNNSIQNRIIPMEENAILDAKNLVAEILSFSSRVKAATLLPPERIRLQRRIFDCYVLHFYDSDLRGNHSAIGSEETIWIDKKRNVIVKTQKKIESYQLLEAPGARIPISIEETTLYMKVELNGAEPAKSFVFLAPLGSRRVDVFPDSLIGTVQERVPELIGKPAPDVEWQGTEGSVKLSAFRGKPVLIEFWASWCAACIDLIPELKQLYAETADHGLVWLSIDEDVDPTRARDFLRENRVPWPNYHDKNGLIEKAFARETIPLVVLVDRDGKVFFYKSGYETSELRAAIVQLGAEFRQIQGNANRK